MKLSLNCRGYCHPLPAPCNFFLDRVPTAIALKRSPDKDAAIGFTYKLPFALTGQIERVTAELK
ncbi:MAG TPA: hypothetical protein VFG04_26290 [Planctomycetaceae bacterium]|nr:hypothetical protein [Planctomycetaceae bacterium]